ncbi:MAG: hypothetical protein K2L10_06765 [Ruminococcus sp.]|nr:hypothetical protein [Ruminococcus sp.]
MKKIFVSKKINILIKVIVSIVVVIILAFTGFYYHVKHTVEAQHLAFSIHGQGWKKYISYDMLSDDLQEIISEEEFSDTDPKNKFRMYRKLENMIIDNRDQSEFYATTTGVKTPYVEFYETDGKKYRVDFRIDIDNHFGKMEVRNFCCHIHEVQNIF